MGLDLGNLKKVWTGATKVISGDWKGFGDVYSGVKGLFENGDAFSRIDSDPYMKPHVSLMGYKDKAPKPRGAGKITELGDTAKIPDWSRNQAVAMYYLNMINKITTQGSPRKGA
jgi:hypothetical protein|tara:strand:- start:1586 stop:1927 length:342 start_codon:yes stop_codon:yes gene_type:complete